MQLYGVGMFSLFVHTQIFRNVMDMQLFDVFVFVFQKRDTIRPSMGPSCRIVSITTMLLRSVQIDSSSVS